MHHEPTNRSQHAPQRTDCLLLRGDTLRVRFAQAVSRERSCREGKEAGAQHVASDPHDTTTTPVTPRPADSKPQPKEEQKPEPGKRKGTAEQAVSPAIQRTAVSSPAQATSRAAAQNKAAPEPQKVTQTQAAKTPTPAPPVKENRRETRLPIDLTARRSESLPPSRPRNPDLSKRSRPSERASHFATSRPESTAPPTSSTRSGVPIATSSRTKNSPLTAGSVLRTPAKK